MVAELWGVENGLRIENEDLTSGFDVLQNTGVPGSRQEEQDAPVGSLYIRTDASSTEKTFWWKYRDVNDDITDWQIGASEEFVQTELEVFTDQIQVDTGSAPATVVTVLDDTLLVSEATNVEWMVQVRDSSGRRETFKALALTNGVTSKFNKHSRIRIGGPIGNIRFRVNIGGSPLAWIVTLEPTVGAGDLTYTLKRVGFSNLPDVIGSP